MFGYSSVLGAHVQVGLRLGQPRHDGGMVLAGGPHHRGLASPGLARVDVGAGRRSAAPPPRPGRSAPRPSGRSRRRDWRRWRWRRRHEQRPTIGRLPVGGRQRERRHAVARRGVDAARRPAPARARSSSWLPRTAQCSAVVPSASVRPPPRGAANQRAHRRSVAALHGVDETRVGAGALSARATAHATTSDGPQQARSQRQSHPSTARCVRCCCRSCPC